MIKTQAKKHETLRKRALRVRKHLKGNADRPRLCVKKTNCHIHVQLIDDERGLSLGAVSTLSKELRGTEFGKRNKASAKKLGEMIAKIATEKEINEVVFDRGASKYHGVLHELAEAAREAGLKF
jgi:large subunit ribosomal protein L18